MRYALLVLLLLTTPAFGEPVRNDLAGMWAYVSTYNQFEDGKRVRWFGEKPIGRFSLRRDGNYSHIIACRPEEVIAGTCVVQKVLGVTSLSHFGTFTVDHKKGTFTGAVVWASNASLIGRKQLRVITKLNKNELHYVNHESIAGEEANVVAVLRRIGE